MPAVPQVTDDRLTGYATENVVPITALDRETIDALWAELRKSLHPEDDERTEDCE